MLPKELISRIRQIEIRTKRFVDDVLAGEYHSVFKGRGMEFNEVREYTAGDDFRSIDWNVTARYGHPFVKRYVEERELTVILVVDVSGSERFGTKGQMKSELCAELSALLAFSAIRNNDRVGLILFSGEVEKFVPPKKGRKHVLRLIREILYFQPSGATTSISNALQFMAQVQKRRCVAFLISDLIDEGYEKTLSIAARRYDLIALKISDPREREMPRIGFLEVEDAETGETFLLDTQDREFQGRYQQLAEKREQSCVQMFNRIGLDHVPIQTGESYIIPLVRFFQRRARER
ncbi:MAG TPA: DUF58 domain-containing protein [bacterium]|nr:DUF58 domain-containing protein [bacterium]